MHYFNQTFTGTTIRLDGHRYQSCTFRDCTIQFGGIAAGTALEECAFIGCQWAFVDAAADTIRFMEQIYAYFGPEGRAMIERTFESIRRGAEHGAPPPTAEDEITGRN